MGRFNCIYQHHIIIVIIIINIIIIIVIISSSIINRITYAIIISSLNFCVSFSFCCGLQGFLIV